MAKSWKSLFIKEDETTESKPSVIPKKEFPVKEETPSFNPDLVKKADHEFKTSYTPKLQSSSDDSSFEEVLKVYEKGLESINMPGYDFFEFYTAIHTVGESSETAYTMAYKMAKTLDSTITPSKMIQDAEFYLSKIREVHKQYEAQGSNKLGSLENEKKTLEKKIESEINSHSQEIEHLKARIIELENMNQQKIKELGKIPEQFNSKIESIQEKLNANDKALEVSVSRIENVKNGITKYLN
jgi:hypothetical protein